MSMIPISAVQAPCNNHCSRVHTLDCGHTVEFEVNKRCRVNCEAIAKIIKEQNPPVKDHSRIVCSRCHFNLWHRATWHLRTAYRYKMRQLKDLEEFQQADVVQQELMMDKLIDDEGILDMWAKYAIEQEEKEVARGNLWGDWLIVDEAVDDLADIFGASTQVDTDGDQLMGEEAPAPTAMLHAHKKSLVPALKPLWMSTTKRDNPLHDVLARMELLGGDDNQEVGTDVAFGQ